MSSTMVTPSDRLQYQQNLPHHIQEKLGLLTMLGNLMESLEIQLQNIRKEHARLEAEMEAYRIQNVPATIVTIAKNQVTTKVPPISRCPNEVLYLIFQQCLIPSHRQIGKLLFVCKHWNTMVMNTPGVWARIEIYDAKDFFIPSKQNPTIAYISACTVRSRDILLDVHLNLEYVPYHSGYIGYQLEDRVANIVHEDDEMEFMIQILDTEWEYTPRDYDSVFEKFTECIFGIDGSQLARWASLILTLPYDVEAAMEIWPIISFPFPNLKKFIIYQVPVEITSPTPFAPLQISSVEKLIVRMEPLPVPWNLFHLSGDILTQLAFDFDERMKNIAEISSFTSLRILELSGKITTYDDDDTWMPPDPSTWPIYSINLPQLTELSLCDHYEVLRAVHFHLPLLDKLTIQSLDRFNKLPILSPRRIEWQINSYWENQWKQKDIYAALNSFVALSPASITIPELAEATGLSTTAPVRRKQAASTPAIQLYVERKDRRIEQLSEEKRKRLLALAKTG